MASKTSRRAKVPKKYADNAFYSETQKCEKWCTIYCHEEDKNHVVHSNNLETEGCEFVTDKDLKVGGELVWRYKGLPYTIEVIEVHDEKPRSVSGRKRHVFDEDSTSDESSDEKLDAPQPASKRTVESTCIEKSDVQGLQSPGQVKNKPKKKETSTESIEMTETTSEGASPTEFLYSAGSEESDVQKIQPSKAKKTCKTKSLAAKLLNSRKSGTSTEDFEGTESSASSSCFSSADFKISNTELLKKLETVQKEMNIRFAHLEKLLMSSNKPTQIAFSTSEEDTEKSKSPVLTDQDQEKYTTDNGINLLNLRAVDPSKYALALMDALFEDSEMAQCCFIRGKRSTKPPLPEAKTNLVQDCINHKFGEGTFSKNAALIIRKCNQKCLDSNRRIKKEQ